MACANIEICPFYRDRNEIKEQNRKAVAFGRKKVDYYRLRIDMGSIRKGTIFYHDPDDDIRGSFADGCLKLCWTFDGDCQNGVCANTIVFPTGFIYDEDMFQKVEDPRRKRTQGELIQEIINTGGLYRPDEKALYILDKNSDGRVCGIYTHFVRPSTDKLARELLAMKKPCLIEYVNNLPGPKWTSGNYYPLNSKEDLYKQVKDYIANMPRIGALITIQEFLILIGVKY